MSKYINPQFGEILSNTLDNHPFLTSTNLKWIILNTKIEPSIENLLDIKNIMRKTYNDFKNNTLYTEESINLKILQLSLEKIKLFFDIKKNEKGLIEVRNEYLKNQITYEYNDIYTKHSKSIDRKKFSSKNEHMF
jgi:hypothetical protein